MKIKYYNIRDNHGRFMSMNKLDMIATSTNPIRTVKKLSTKSSIKVVKKSIPYFKLSIVEKRKAIAKDVIKWVKSNRFIASPGNYTSIDNYEKEEENKGFDKVFKSNKDITCYVCAKGALFLSQINKTNNCSIIEADNVFNGKICDKVKEFPKANLDLIEGAFEGYFLNEKIRNFYLKFNNDDDRLIAIMKNIIANPKGLFKL